MFLRLYLLPAPKEGRLPAEDALDHTQNLPRRSSTTGLVFSSHKNGWGAVQGCLRAQWCPGGTGIFSPLCSAQQPWHLQEERQTGKASPGVPLSGGGRPFPEALSLARAVSCDHHSNKGSWENGDTHSSSKGGTAVAVR